jgi:hypothetical protein
MEHAILANAAELRNLADAINHLAVANQAARTPPGAAKPPVGAGPSMPPVGGPPPASGEREKKMGSKVYAICTQNGWDIPAVGETITGHTMAKDSRTWSFADLTAVLDQFSAWGYP